MLTVNELFAGIGAFRKALINLNIPHEIVGISEIDKYAIKSYEALYGKTRNYGDISKVDKLDYADLWTYGFPCQDISLAGLQRGIIKGETRSGLLYEVQRLLEVSALHNELPKYLIMENVKPLVGKKFLPKFNEWLKWLDNYGYYSYWQIMNAADYGIPQKRERVVCVSIRKDLKNHFSFPKPQSLEIKFSDLLENQVDEKFYLKQETYEWFEKHSRECEEKGLSFRFSPIDKKKAEIAKTVTTKPDRIESNYIRECKRVATLTGSKWDKYESTARVYDTDGLCPTLTTACGGHHEVKIMCDKSNVRKLTPRESWRLMGFNDLDFEKAQAVNSNSQLYKQAGNSIVVNVLEEVLRSLLREEDKT
mgnify:CR=1 FL=1